MIVLKPPTPFGPFIYDRPSVFLAGSIEMGKAEDWQTTVEHALADMDVLVFNPRRDDWDDTWQQSITDTRFRQQVMWELLAQDAASLIVFYFSPPTFAPITLLELGLAARTNKIIVCCPDGFYRKGNVEVVCVYYTIPLVNSLPELIVQARQRLTEKTMEVQAG